MKIRVQMGQQIRFYYPDLSIICTPNPREDSFHDKPVVLFEILSRATRRTDEGEKRDAYLTIPSLLVYALVDQDEPAVVLWRRTANMFDREVYSGLDAVIPLGEVGAALPLSEIYDAVTFAPEPSEDE
jgi:Uma2 family endonuclease